jgi:hypothetical protein
VPVTRIFVLPIPDTKSGISFLTRFKAHFPQRTPPLTQFCCPRDVNRRNVPSSEKDALSSDSQIKVEFFVEQKLGQHHRSMESSFLNLLALPMICIFVSLFFLAIVSATPVDQFRAMIGDFNSSQYRFIEPRFDLHPSGVYVPLVPIADIKPSAVVRIGHPFELLLHRPNSVISGA